MDESIAYGVKMSKMIDDVVADIPERDESEFEGKYKDMD